MSDQMTLQDLKDYLQLQGFSTLMMDLMTSEELCAFAERAGFNVDPYIKAVIAPSEYITFEEGKNSMINEKVIKHREICNELSKLYERKNHDYGDSFHQTFVEEGLAMSRIRIGDKFSRFKTLSKLTGSDENKQQVTDESLRDTLMDLANYAIMTILEMDIDKPKETFDVHFLPID